MFLFKVGGISHHKERGREIYFSRHMAAAFAEPGKPRAE